MGKLVQCYYCKIKEDKDNENIIFQLPNKKYVHNKCYDFVQREKKELDDLVEEIKRIHNISVIPSRFYPFLQDLRNGTNRCQRSFVKKKKEGYRFLIIKKTYQFYEKQIKQSLFNKKINDTNNKLLYSYAIVVSKVDKVRDKLLKEHRERIKYKESINETQENQEKIVIENPTNKNKKPYDWLKEGD